MAAASGGHGGIARLLVSLAILLLWQLPGRSQQRADYDHRGTLCGDVPARRSDHLAAWDARYLWSGLERRESRGSHTRRDYPDRDDEQYLRHSLAFASPDGPRIDYRVSDSRRRGLRRPRRVHQRGRVQRHPLQGERHRRVLHDFSSVEDHRKTLAAPLRVPDNPRPPVPNSLHCRRRGNESLT